MLRSLKTFFALTVVLCAASSIPQTLPAATGHLELKVLDKDTGRLVPCRIHLAGPKGRPVRIPKFPFWHDHSAFPGLVQLTLPLGNYTFELERGLEYLDRSGHFTIENFADDSHQVDLRRFVDMAAQGWYSGDLDLRRKPAEIELLMLADDLHLAEVVAPPNAKPAPGGSPTVKKGKSSPLAPGESPGVKAPVRFDKNRYYAFAAWFESEPGIDVTFNRLAKSDEIPSGKLPPFSLVERVMAVKEKHPDVWIDVSKPFAWDLPALVALKAVDSIQVVNRHLCRETMIANEAGGKPRDKFLYPGPRGNAQWSQDIYFKLLECGLRIPPTAGSGSGLAPNPAGYNRAYVNVKEKFSYDAWWENLRAGRVFITNGPLMQISVQGQPPGYVFQADKGRAVDLEIGLTLSTRQPISYLEIVQNGLVKHNIRFADYAGAGKLPKVRFDQSGWFTVRAVTDSQKTYCFALSGPYYVEIGYQPRISKKATLFFLNWIDERIEQIKIDNAQQQQKVLDYYNQARKFWQDLSEKATAE